MRNKEEILEDVKCCLYGICGGCSKNFHGVYDCENKTFEELVCLIEDYEAKLKTHAKPIITEEDIKLAYSKGGVESWDLATKVADFALSGDIYDIFGEIRVADVFHNYTPYDVKMKIEAWEKLKSIRVGDEVRTEDIKAVVLDQYTENKFYVFTENGCVEYWDISKNIEKTGKHIDLDGLFKQIGE